jgi:hypothetical protein
MNTSRLLIAAQWGRGAAMPRVRSRSLVGATIVALAATMVLASSALATLTRRQEPFSPLTGTASDVTLAKYGTSSVAVDEATGNVFATSASAYVSEGIYEGTEGVVILGGEGGEPVGLASPFAILGTGFFRANAPGEFLAYDNASTSPSKGTVYVYERSAETIERYVRNATTERYSEVAGAGIHLPGCGSDGDGDVDAKGDLYFICNGLTELYEFGPTGALIHEYNLMGTPLVYENFLGELQARPGQIAVDGIGDVFVQTGGGGGVYKLPVSLTGEVEPSQYELVASSAQGLAYEPSSNEVIVTENGRVGEYDATTLDKLGTFGSEVFQYEFEGNKYPAGTGGVTVNSKTHRIYVVGIQQGIVAVFGADLVVPTPVVTAASNVTGSKATLNGSVNAEGTTVTKCFFEYGATTAYGKTIPCAQAVPSGSEADPVSASISGLESNGVTYHYRLVAENENGAEQSADKTLVTEATVITNAASEVTATSAVLHGAVRPEGSQFSDCELEYGLTTNAGFESKAPCAPSAAELEPDFSEHPVEAHISGLVANATYKFRLSAENPAGSRSGKTLTFTTVGPPQISEVRARDATQSTVVLEAKIDPSGSGTSYHFEWGTTNGYGNNVPVDFEPYVGEGGKPVLVTAKLTGLSASMIYHYRVVAQSSEGSAATADHQAETLDSCGLPEDRCYELVSPPNVGTTAQPGIVKASGELSAQPSASGDSLAYSIEGGLPGVTKGGTVLYQATRHETTGWTSEQISPPMVARDEQKFGTSVPNQTLALSPDLSCGVVSSVQPIDNTAAMEQVVEAGGANLYLRDEGAFTPITTLAPVNPEPSPFSYELMGMSGDCKTVAFTTTYQYPGIKAPPTTGIGAMYEWRDGKLQGVGVILGPEGETPVAATPGGDERSAVNIVSSDGSRIFFSAARRLPGNPADAQEAGARGVFAREDGATTRDLSASETTTPDLNAEYLYATPSGSHVFFRANYGLTEATSAEEATSECEYGNYAARCDLYEYDLEKAPSEHPLTDLSADADPGGAHVTGFVGASADGSHVYFLAQGQLAPGKGRTLAENREDGTDSIYSEQRGQRPQFVATVTEREAAESVGVAEYTSQVSNVSPSGRYLLFETSQNVTGYNSGSSASSEAYLYDAQAGSEPVICVSCRQDGLPSRNSNTILSNSNEKRLFHPNTLVIRNGQPLVFFESTDPLTGEAGAEERRQYEWAHNEVYLLAAPGDEAAYESGGADEDGSDFFFSTAAALTWEDGDARSSIYDARIGGGFSEPPPSGSEPCQAAVEGSCQGSAPVSSPALSPGTANYGGPGNLVPTPATARAQGTKPLTGAQKLAAALKVCRKDRTKLKRVKCESQARVRYKAKTKAKSKKKGSK